MYPTHGLAAFKYTSKSCLQVAHEQKLNFIASSIVLFLLPLRPVGNIVGNNAIAMFCFSSSRSKILSIILDHFTFLLIILIFTHDQQKCNEDHMRITAFI